MNILKFYVLREENNLFLRNITRYVVIFVLLRFELLQMEVTDLPVSLFFIV
jgi:hypothetical protein